MGLEREGLSVRTAGSHKRVCGAEGKSAFLVCKQAMPHYILAWTVVMLSASELFTLLGLDEANERVKMSLVREETTTSHKPHSGFWSGAIYNHVNSPNSASLLSRCTFAMHVSAYPVCSHRVGTDRGFAKQSD